MKKRPSITLLTVLLAMVFAAGIGVYSSYIGMKIYQESSDHLLESFSQISKTFALFVQRNWTVLSQWDGLLENADSDADADSIWSDMQSSKASWRYSDFYLVNESTQYLTADGRKVLDNVSFRVNKGDKIAFVGEDEIAKTTLFKIVMGEMEPDEGTYKWGTTITTSYFPLDNSAFFNDCDLNLVDWLAQFTPKIPEANTESFKRAFLGRMLFSGDDVFKPVKVLSGGEKVRCMLSRMMLYGSNVLVLDQPTNHLDLESITAVNNGLVDFKGVVLFASHDHEFVQTIANRIMVLEDGKLTDRLGTYEDYIASMANTAE